MKKLVLETTAPFQGLPELVAYDEGLFEKEGLIVEWADREKDVEKSTDINVISPQGLDPFSSHGKLLEQGQADMYNACEWGNYCRVQETQVGSRQVGRRGIVSYAAIVVRPDSPVFTGQQLAGQRRSLGNRHHRRHVRPTHVGAECMAGCKEAERLAIVRIDCGCLLKQGLRDYIILSRHPPVVRQRPHHQIPCVHVIRGFAIGAKA